MNYVGTARPIHDAKGKATGYSKYAGDISLSNMAYLCMLHSKIPHGYVKAVHAEKALALPGVYGVYHCLNTSERKYNRYRSSFDQAYLANEERAFNQYVRFVGDKIGAVAACDQETAEKAARLVEVEYEELSFSIGFDDTLAGKNCLDGETPVRDEYELDVGEKQGSAEGLIEVCSTMELPRLHHATMETHACIADYDPYSDMLTVYCPNQAVHGIRTVLADFLEMPESHVRVVKATMGGSFGAKQEWFLEPVTALVAKKLCRPVKLVYSRGEAMTDTIVRGAMRMSARGYYTPDGEMKEIYCDVTLDAGAYIGNAGDYVRALAGKPTRCYRIPYMHYHGQVISSNSPVSGAFRSWSAAEEALMMERQLDAAAEKLGMDRLAIRLKNVARSGEEDKKLHLSLEDIRIGDAITLGSEKFGWDKLKAEDAAFNASQQRYRRGVGIGIGGHGNTYFPRFNDYGEGSISLNADGSMQANFTLHDHGCGTVTAMRMIAAEVLKVPEDKIYMTEGDTAVTPIDYGCFASRTTYVVGRAVQDAASALRKKMLHAGIYASGYSRRRAVLKRQPHLPCGAGRAAPFVCRACQKEHAHPRRQPDGLRELFERDEPRRDGRALRPCRGRHLDGLYKGARLSRRARYRSGHQPRPVRGADPGRGADGLRRGAARKDDHAEGRPLHGEFVQISSVPCKRPAEHPRGAFAGRTLEGGPVRREIHRRGLLCAGRSGGVRRGERRAAREPLGAAV